MYNSTAGSNYDRTAAFDRQNPAASRSFFSSKHNITTRLGFREEFFEDLSTRFAVSFVARSGRPYSLTFTGGGVFNDTASGFENRSEEHTSELQSLMRISYAVFCLKKKKQKTTYNHITNRHINQQDE